MTNEVYQKGPVDSRGDFPTGEAHATFGNETIRVTFRWWFQGAWQRIEGDLSRPTYDYYHERTRPITGDYSVFVTEPFDDTIINALSSQLQDLSIDLGLDRIAMANFVLGFVQSIPYATDDVTTPFDEYPRYPVETLVDAASDCEDTSILFASLMTSLGFDAILVGPPRHMAVGVALEGARGTSYAYQGQRYYFAETTGKGFEIGDYPDGLQGDGAEIFPLVPKAVLQELTWRTADDGSRVNFTATSGGSESARAVVFFAGWDAGGDRVWGRVSSTSIDIGPGDAAYWETSLSRPPTGVQTRLEAWLTSDNAPSIVRYGNWFYS